MKILPLHPSHRMEHRTHGMTLMEMMVAVVIGFMVLMVMATVFISSNRMFAELGNYVGMDQASQQTLERMTRDIRKSKNLISYSTNSIVFNYAGTTTLSFTYLPISKRLMRSMTGQPDTCIMTNCEYLEFAMYKNAPLSGGTFGKTTSPALGKCIQVTWKCSKTSLGVTRTSQNVEQALIVIRNKPVL